MHLTRLATAAAAIAVVLLTGCAANVSRTSASPAGATPTVGATGAAVPATPPVALHPDAARKLVLQVVPEGAARGSSDWQSFQGEWRSAFAAAAAARNLPFAYIDSPTPPPREAGTLLQAVVRDYRYVSTGARIGLGIMTGNAFVDARLRFIDLATGRVVNEQTLNTTSSAWQGVFSAMTSRQLETVARDVVDDVKPR